MNLENNPLLTPLENLIDYAKIKPEHIEPAMDYLLSKDKALVQELCAIEEPNWQNFIEPGDYQSAHLWRAWSVVNHLNSVVNTAQIREAYGKVLPQVSAYSTWLGLNRDLFKQYLKIQSSADFKKLSATRQRIINEAIKNFKLSGVELEGQAKEDYAKINEQLANLSQQFSLNALDAVDQWHHNVTDEAELSGLPEDAKQAAKALAQSQGQEGWTFTLKMPSFLPVMQYADSRQLRQCLHRAYSTLASDQGDSRYDNSQVIEQILDLRQREAKLLGFEDYAQMSLSSKMADTPQQIIHFLRDMAQKAKPFAQKDVADLSAFAKQTLEMPALQPWDYAYVSEKYRQQLFAYSDEEVRQYLPLDKVLSGLFKLIEKLYGVTFKASPDIVTWDAAVQVFEVHEAQQVIGYLYLDLFARTGKQSGAWVAPERTRHRYQDNLLVPVVYLTCNFSAGNGEQPALLRHDDVITLFHETGHALHGLLSRVDDPAAGPFSAVEWDAIELPSQFMENFCWEWPVMQDLTAHWQTHETMPKALFEKLLQAKNFQSGMQTVRQIEFGLFDMLLHSTDKRLKIKDVLETLKQVRQEVAVIMPPEWNRFPHNFSHIFAGGYAAGYYSYKWAEVLSADAYSYFEENADAQHGTVNPRSGRHFRDTILAVGGSKPAAEFFRDFRGRDPEVDALLRHNGMQAN
ncbi:M3 family metallopeptidase [Brackiella oedipodis]|uniref:M3 family metallopeptidase n=1 Tax=Brackiella oedipodis TaxID=124225 RepID=UPI00048B9834|nr:M3 family metallopeptidase [Brackiella oedipodis]